MIQSGQLRPVVNERNVVKFHAVVPGCDRMVGDFQRRRTHHLVDAAQSGLGQHHAAGGEHDPGQGGGDDGREHGIEGKVRHKARKGSGT